jgi:nucleoside triphosphatase
MKYPEAVVGAVILNAKNKVLIVRSTKWNSKYIIPGGHIELGEKMKDALIREVKEETGLKIYDIELLSLKESIYSKSFGEQKHFIFIDYLTLPRFVGH